MSSARQTVTPPAGQKATVPLKYRLQIASWYGYDDQFIAILDEYGYVSKLWHIPVQHNGQWIDFSEDISQYAGRSVKVYFGVTNDGFGGSTSLVVDDVALCIGE